jgi:hypothetical protein
MNRYAHREPLLLAEYARDALFILAFAGAIYSNNTVLSLVAGAFTLAASLVLTCVARAMSLPVELPVEPELVEPDLTEPGSA